MAATLLLNGTQSLLPRTRAWYHPRMLWTSYPMTAGKPTTDAIVRLHCSIWRLRLTLIQSGATSKSATWICGEARATPNSSIFSMRKVDFTMNDGGMHLCIALEPHYSQRKIKSISSTTSDTVMSPSSTAHKVMLTSAENVGVTRSKISVSALIDSDPDKLLISRHARLRMVFVLEKI
jgi:hypothetical protein